MFAACVLTESLHPPKANQLYISAIMTMFDGHNAVSSAEWFIQLEVVVLVEVVIVVVVEVVVVVVIVVVGVVVVVVAVVIGVVVVV
ncbi:hypothetical protein ElyMa_003492000 [Elysia marginata]|uniref:Uncharacterized protein n=1 Tax=Elysia marginata TaxID=1093978 RepID=A0AAV4EF44_9GAST|nr:hypothetical protein ElyMa_003492000 [Elysia marginata]